MRISPILFLHICCGVLGLLSGAAAISLRKGSARHRLMGNVFVISMLGLGASGAYMGFMKDQVLNVAMGVLTCYLVVTARMTARRKDGETGIFDFAALVVPLAVGAALVTYGSAAASSQTGLKDGVPAAPYFIFGSVALLFAGGDVRMLVRGGVSAAQRLARHLGRMCFALFIATGSLFLARPHLFPALFRKTGIIFLLGILPVILMIFWLFRVRFSKAYKKKKSLPGMANVHTLKTQPSTSPAGKTQAARAIELRTLP